MKAWEGDSSCFIGAANTLQKNIFQAIAFYRDLQKRQRTHQHEGLLFPPSTDTKNRVPAIQGGGDNNIGRKTF